jgi:hypothetical protein
MEGSQLMNLEMRLTPETIEIVCFLFATLDNDFDKVFHWLTTKNLNFGGASPLLLINRGRAHKVLEFLAKEIRVVTFGMGSMMNVVCVQPPKKIEDCGMYVHMDDVQKFLEYQAALDGAFDGVQRQEEGT